MSNNQPDNQPLSEYEAKKHPRGRYQDIGLVAGLIVALVLWFLPTPEGLTDNAWRVVAIGALMAIWWATEAIPVPATSLIPIVAFPLAGITTAKEATYPYAEPIIFLLLGGFIVAMGMQRWGLHRRIALTILSKVGGNPVALIAGFMGTAAILSMWISNTATTLMMVPIALSVSQTVLGKSAKGHAFTICLLIGTAWAASIGGLGTPIGTPPNAFVVAFIEEQSGRMISFPQWMALGVPIAMVMVPLAWLTVTKLVFPFDPAEAMGGGDVIAKERAALGSITTEELRVAIVFGVMAVSWTTQPLLKTLPGLGGLSSTVIAMAGALLMFLVPAGKGKKAFLLDWDYAAKLPWGVIILFGGGLSLAAAVKSTGLALWLGAAMSGLAAVHLIILMLAIVTLVIFLTELTSNTATTATLVPVLAALATVSNIDPMILAAPTAMAASCAFMLPVATGPNAVVFASGEFSIPQMAKAGFILNIFGMFVVTGMCYVLVPMIFG